MRAARLTIFAVICFGLIFIAFRHIEDQRARNWFIVVPVRVHLLRSNSIPAANCHLSVSEVRRIFARAAHIWEQGRIHLELETVVEEQVPSGAWQMITGDQLTQQTVSQVRPEESRDTKRIHVYYVHQMNGNGLFQGLDAIYVKETAQLQTVDGGIDEPLPRVTAHEIGHAFGLPHSATPTNLMYSGTSGISLSTAEIETARGYARVLPFAHLEKTVAPP